MPLSDLQKFLENSIPGACVPVDLLKIAKSVGTRRQARGAPKALYGNSNSSLTLVIDGECCLDRLYGGFFSDWVCGGQWNRMVEFLGVLIQTVQYNNIELAVFFNGSLEQQRLNEWSQNQNARRKHINSVLRHVSVKGTPPPKVWWVAPTGLRMCLRMALWHLGIQVVCTMDDHHQEVIAFCRENNYHGLMAEDAEYVIFDPPRYFSSHQLKLTYKGSLETKEFILDEIEKGLNLPRNYFCFLATLLGNYLLTEKELKDFYASIIPGYNKEQNTHEELIRAVAKFIKSCDVNNLMTLGAQIFGSMSDPRVAKFKESVQYFLNGTKDGFLQYKPLQPGQRDTGLQSSQYNHLQYQFSSIREKRFEPPHETIRRPSVPSVKEESAKSLQNEEDITNNEESSCKSSQVPELVVEGHSTGNVQQNSAGNAPQISDTDVPNKLENALESRLGEFTVIVTDEDERKTSNDPEKNENKDKDTPGGGGLGSTPSGSPRASLLLSSSSSSSNSSSASPYRLTPEVSWAEQIKNSSQSSKSDESLPAANEFHVGKEGSTDFCPVVNSSPNTLPPIPHEVNRTASERHQKGLMCPWVYQVINQGEVKFEPTLQDEICSEFPNAVLFFRPIRQYVYAVLFNLHHHVFMSRKAKEEGQKPGRIPEIKIREWVYTKENPYNHFEIVEGISINWAVPTVQRLWFGTIIEDKKRRLRAFLSCLHADSPLMLHTSYVPQHLLIMATVLRFIISRNEMAILKKQEFDAFLVTAFSPELANAQYLQDIQIPMLSPRAIQLASFFMVGIEMAVFANDACGSPIPWHMCCPWLFFDGKLFHSILNKANCSRSLMEVCEGDMDLVDKVEKCREAILEGLLVKFIQPQPIDDHPIPISNPLMPGISMHHPHNQQQIFPGPYPDQPSGKPRGFAGRNGGPGRRLYSRGGQLQVAGIVVGQWGPNFGTTNSRNHHQNGFAQPGRGRYKNTTNIARPSGRGRPAVLAKRRMIRRKDVQTGKGGRTLQTAPQDQQASLQQPPMGYNGQQVMGGGLIAINHPQGDSYSAPQAYNPPQTNGGDHYSVAAYNYPVTESNENGVAHFYTPSHHNDPGSLAAPYHSHPVCISNHKNNGLKSPDSGVNVSIME